MEIVEIAAVCHEANRMLCLGLGDTSQTGWMNAPEWQRESATQGVVFHLANPEAGPDASHEAWRAHKRIDGWVYGDTKDAEAKTHPCMVDFDALPREQQAKDVLFRNIVHSLAPLLHTST